jgi:hypothetical protein
LRAAGVEKLRLAEWTGDASDGGERRIMSVCRVHIYNARLHTEQGDRRNRWTGLSGGRRMEALLDRAQSPRKKNGWKGVPKRPLLRMQNK